MAIHLAIHDDQDSLSIYMTELGCLTSSLAWADSFTKVLDDGLDYFPA